MLNSSKYNYLATYKKIYNINFRALIDNFFNSAYLKTSNDWHILVTCFMTSFRLLENHYYVLVIGSL